MSLRIICVPNFPPFGGLTLHCVSRPHFVDPPHCRRALGCFCLWVAVDEAPAQAEAGARHPAPGTRTRLRPCGQFSRLPPRRGGWRGCESLAAPRNRPPVRFPRQPRHFAPPPAMRWGPPSSRPSQRECFPFASALNNSHFNGRYFLRRRCGPNSVSSREFTWRSPPLPCNVVLGGGACGR